MTRPILSAFPEGADPFQELPDSHSGLDFAYGAGRVRDDNAVADTAAGTVTLTDAATNYIEVTGAGAVSANTVGFTSGRIPLYTVVTSGGGIGTVADQRAFLQVPGSGGGTPGLVLIEEIELASTSSTITFDNIPGTYSDLFIRGLLRHGSGGVDVLRARFGTGGVVDTGSNYDWVNFQRGDFDDESTGYANTQMVIGSVGTNSPLNVEVLGYADTGYPRVLSNVARAEMTDASNYRIGAATGRWNNTTDAIDVIELNLQVSTFAVGTKLRLYGIA